MHEMAMVLQITANFVVIKVGKRLVKAKLRGKLQSKQPILVGDYVRFTKVNDNDYVIETILPRKNELFRPKIANVDQIFIINSLIQPVFQTVLLNKLLTIFHFYQIPVNLVFTKQDLVAFNNPVWKLISQFDNLNYSIYTISNQTKIGITEIIPCLSKKLSLFTGVSGVGKSSLINNLDPNLNLATKTVSEINAKGRHTTTSTNIYYLHNGMIADSPGYMTFQLIGLTSHDIAQNFPVLMNYINQCKFQDCLHQHEPGCAVIADLKNEKTAFFYQDYCKILKELEYYQTKE